MTIKEALKTKSENLTVSDSKLDLVLIESTLNGGAEYDPQRDGKELDLVYVTLLLFSISIVELKEDDVSIKYSNNLKDIISAIYRKYKMFDPYADLKPTVKQVKLW